MNPEMQAALLNTYPPKLITTILKALREQLKESGQLHSGGDCRTSTRNPSDYDRILKGRRFWDDVDGGYLPEDLVLAARREEIDWVHPASVDEVVPMQECSDAGMKPLSVIWVDTQVCGSDTQEDSIEVVCKRVQNEEAR